MSSNQKHFRNLSVDTLKVTNFKDIDNNDYKLIERINNLEDILLNLPKPINTMNEYISNMSIDGLPVYIEKNNDTINPYLNFNDVVMLYYGDKKASYNTENDGTSFDLDYSYEPHNYFKFVSETGKTGYIMNYDYIFLERVNEDGSKKGGTTNHYIYKNGNGSAYSNGIANLPNKELYRIRVNVNYI